MPRLNIEIPEDLKQMIRDYKAAYGMSEAAVVRSLLYAALRPKKTSGRPDRPADR